MDREDERIEDVHGWRRNVKLDEGEIEKKEMVECLMDGGIGRE